MRMAPVVLALAVAVLFGFEDFRVDEMECEHAIAHLEECCEGFVVDEQACNYDDGCGTVQEPILSIKQSECVQDLDCAGVKAQDLCARVPELVNPTSGEAGANVARENVCR